MINALRTARFIKFGPEGRLSAGFERLLPAVDAGLKPFKP